MQLKKGAEDGTDDHGQLGRLTHPGSIKVLIVEPLVLMRDALTCLLQSVDGMVVVGEADSASGLMAVVDAKQPDVVLVAIDGTGDVESALLEELPRRG